MAAAALVGIQVGAATVASRFALIETDPISLALMRYIIGVVCLAPFVLWAPRPRFRSRDLAPMAALGIVQFGVLVIFLNVALEHIPAARAALVFAAFPLLTMLFAALVGSEALTLAKTTGVVLTMAGAGVALADKAFVAVPGGASWIGEISAFAAALCGALCSVLYRPYLRRYPALSVSAFAMVASVGFLAGVVVVLGIAAEPLKLSGVAGSAVIFIGVSSGIGYSVLLWAFARTTPTRVTIFQALAPVTATGLGWMFLGENTTPAFLAGLVLVVLGITIAHWPSATPGARRAT
jgi:drug/metabolite transporter (DMT)-like permease